MQVIDGALRMRGGGKDRPLIIPQDLKPATNIGGMVRTVL